MTAKFRFFTSIWLALFWAGPVAAQGIWSHSIVELKYSDPDRVGGYWIEGQNFFAMFTCSPRAPTLQIELGFPEPLAFDTRNELMFLRLQGQNYFLPFLYVTETTGFLQAYMQPGQEHIPWGGQALFLARLLEGNEIEVLAAPIGDLSSPRILARIGAEPGGASFRLLQKTCVTVARVPKITPLPLFDLPASE